MHSSLRDADDDEASPYFMQMRWSAAVAAAKTLQGECDVLLEVMELAAQAWRNARLRLASVESMRDQLSLQLSDSDVFIESAIVARELAA